jgi:hypothetical protein
MTDEERATRLSAALNLLRLDSLTTGDDPEEKRQHEAIRAAFAAVRKEERDECARRSPTPSG